MDSPLFDCSGMVSQNHFQMLVERAWQVVQHEPWVMTGYIHIADTFEDDKFPCLPTVMCIHVGVASCQKQSGALRNDQFSVYEMATGYGSSSLSRALTDLSTSKPACCCTLL